MSPKAPCVYTPSIYTVRRLSKAVCYAFFLSVWSLCVVAADPTPLTISWEKNYLTVRGSFPGKEIKTHYLEAFCRPGSTDRDWKETVIPHTAEVLEATSDGKLIKLRDKLADGVVVEHTIT